MKTKIYSIALKGHPNLRWSNVLKAFTPDIECYRVFKKEKAVEELKNLECVIVEEDAEIESVPFNY